MTTTTSKVLDKARKAASKATANAAKAVNDFKTVIMKKPQLKEITFSRKFPNTHPQNGEPTYFVEAILTQLGIKYKTGNYFKWLIEHNPDISDVFLMNFFDSLKRDVNPKSHTIRNHKHPLNVGDFINPKCWAGKPYNKTIEGFWKIKFAPIIEIKKVWDFDVDLNCVYSINGKYTSEQTDYNLATNDGLTETQMRFWFMPNINKPKEFSGKIICWNNNINY